MAYLHALSIHAPVEAARFAGSVGDHLGAAERTLDKLLSPSLKRAAGQNRAPLNRDNRLIAREIEIATREAETLVEHLKRASAALTGRG